jgi:ABC-type Fe3+ transport system permease subunit
MVLLTSVVSSSTYFVFGLILVDFAAVGFFVGLISSFCGQLLMLRVRRARSASGRQFERSSYIAFVIGGVVMVSAVLMTIQYIFSIVEGPDDNVSKLCDVRF